MNRLCVLALIASAVLNSGCASLSRQLRTPPRVGDAFPVLLLRSDVGSLLTSGSAGDSIRLMPKTFDADVLLVYLCSPGCGPCQTGARQINRIEEALRTRTGTPRVAIAGIVLNTPRRSAVRYRDRYGWSFPVFADPGGTVRGRLGRIGTPWFYGLRRNGSHLEVATLHTGTFDGNDDINRFVSRLTSVGEADSDSTATGDTGSRCSCGVTGCPAP